MNKDSKNQVSKDRNDMSDIVTEIIRQLGVPEHIKGFHYLKEAILADKPTNSEFIAFMTDKKMQH